MADDNPSLGRRDWERPSSARMYDYYLGGSSNFAPDREAAERALEAMPDNVVAARTNRGFLRRAVRFMMDQGIRQFLDLGSGVPSVGNVHEVAQLRDPETRVVYVDVDVAAVRQAELLVGQNANVAMLTADLRDPKTILEDRRTQQLLDFSQPLGVLMVAVLHYVPGPVSEMSFLEEYRAVLAPGSHLAVAHLSRREGSEEDLRNFESVYAHTSHPIVHRSAEEIGAMFTGYDLVEPGLVPMVRWRPEDTVSPDHEGLRVAGLAGVGKVAE